MMIESISRRQFLTGCAGLAATPILGAQEQPKEEADFGFFVIGDTHYLADKTKPERLDDVSALTTKGLIETLNRLPGTSIPENAGGGTVAVPRGLIHCGDLIDTGDKSGVMPSRMQKIEWESYAEDFGLTGKDGKLKCPVYEVHGNHDSPQGDGLVIKKITERNQKRTGIGNVSKNGLHCSWDWGPMHCVTLGIVVGGDKKVTRKRRYNPLDSLDFLTSDLADKVGKSGRPVLITHHVDMIRYATACEPEAVVLNKEWDPCDVKAYYEALKGYNVVGILYGHTHVRNFYRWKGTTEKGKEGIPVFNVAKSSHFNAREQALYYFHLKGKELIVRECRTPDRWQTSRWEPQTWSVAVPVAK